MQLLDLLLRDLLVYKSLHLCKKYAGLLLNSIKHVKSIQFEAKSDFGKGCHTRGVFIRWNGLVEWNGGMEYWNSGMPYFIPHLNKAYVYPDAAQAVSVSSQSHGWAIKAIQSDRLSSRMREVIGKAA